MLSEINYLVSSVIFIFLPAGNVKPAVSNIYELALNKPFFEFFKPGLAPISTL